MCSNVNSFLSRASICVKIKEDIYTLDLFIYKRVRMISHESTNKQFQYGPEECLHYCTIMEIFSKYQIKHHINILIMLVKMLFIITVIG
jgi:hypothetical protein